MVINLEQKKTHFDLRFFLTYNIYMYHCFGQNMGEKSKLAHCFHMLKTLCILLMHFYFKFVA